MNWTCHTCQTEHPDEPLCFGVEAPWRGFVPEAEYTQRVELSPDECIIDGTLFFIRGHIEIPIHAYPHPLVFSVWSSISVASMSHMAERWEAADRASDPPYFGWLSSPIGSYPDTRHLKVSVQSRPPGWTPLFTIEHSDHPLSVDQRHGISMDQWHAQIHQLLHT